MGDKDPKGSGFLDSFRGTLWTVFRYATVPGIIMGATKPGSLLNGAVGLNEGLKDTARDAYMAVKFGTTVDLQKTNTAGDNFEQWWRDKVTKNIGLGQYEFRMGAGWELPKGVKYNGVLDPSKEGKKITGLDAVFVRDRAGNVEVLDRKDPRYSELVLPYIVTQVASPAVAGKAVAALKLIAGASQAVEVASRVSSAAGKAGSVGNTSAMLGFAGTHMSNGLILKPAALNHIAHILDNPQELSPDKLRDRLNTIFQQYSYVNGPLSEQYYVPPLSPLDNSLKRLEELSRDKASGCYEFKNPFERLTDLTNKSPHYRESIRLEGVRDAVKDNIDFQKSFYFLAAKAMKGPLTNEELLGLRFGINVMYNDKLSLTNDRGKAEFTPQQRDETVLAVRQIVSILEGTRVAYQSAKDGEDIDLEGIHERGKKSPLPADKVATVLEQAGVAAQKKIQERDAFEKQKLMAQSMAFAMH